MLWALIKGQSSKGVERSRQRLKILWRIYNAPDHRIRRSEVDQDNTLNAHFGWVCTHTARALGETDPGAFILCEIEPDDAGDVWLKLKPNVIDAKQLSKKDGLKALKDNG